MLFWGGRPSGICSNIADMVLQLYGLTCKFLCDLCPCHLFLLLSIRLLCRDQISSCRIKAVKTLCTRRIWGARHTTILCPLAAAGRWVFHGLHLSRPDLSYLKHKKWYVQFRLKSLLLWVLLYLPAQALFLAASYHDGWFIVISTVLLWEIGLHWLGFLDFF